eukprot:6214810-Pleurochrysis_carterae.AAC.3
MEKTSAFQRNPTIIDTEACRRLNAAHLNHAHACAQVESRDCEGLQQACSESATHVHEKCMGT